MDENKFEYKIFSQRGDLVMQTSSQDCRYPARTELSMLNAGYRITLNGKRLTKNSIEK